MSLNKDIIRVIANLAKKKFIFQIGDQMFKYGDYAYNLETANKLNINCALKFVNKKKDVYITKKDKKILDRYDVDFPFKICQSISKIKSDDHITIDVDTSICEYSNYDLDPRKYPIVYGICVTIKDPTSRNFILSQEHSFIADIIQIKDYESSFLYKDIQLIKPKYIYTYEAEEYLDQLSYEHHRNSYFYYSRVAITSMIDYVFQCLNRKDKIIYYFDDSGIDFIRKYYSGPIENHMEGVQINFEYDKNNRMIEIDVPTYYSFYMTKHVIQ